jgi:hypothetical protein
MLTIKFQNEEYVFTGESLEEGGSIARLEDFENGRCSFAHLFPDGNISRFGMLIGTREDIEIIGNCDPNITEHAFEGFLGSSWPFNPSN